LAITPPSGAVDPALVDRWAVGERLGVGVLVRHPGSDLRSLLEMCAEGGRLAALTERCRARAMPMLLSIDAGELSALPEALDQGFAGAQLRGDPGPEALAQLRRALGRRYGGRSCHGAPQDAHAQVDYTCVAPIFSPTTQQAGVTKTAVGLGALRLWSTRPEARIFALGGVGPHNAAACLAAGAWGLAGIGLFFGDPKRVGEDVAAVVDHLDRHLRDVRLLPPR